MNSTDAVKLNNATLREHVERLSRNNDTTLTPIDTWDVSEVTDMSRLFANFSNFNMPLNSWNVSNVTNMESMFYSCSQFNQPLNSWNVSNVTNMNDMFGMCFDFNQPLNNWNVSNVTDMIAMFGVCSEFNQPLDNWNVSNVKEMDSMFNACEQFNQPLNNWNVSNVESMFSMFNGCTRFNQPLNNWDVRQVRHIGFMFYGCSQFNQPLTNWNLNESIDDIDDSVFEGAVSFLDENLPPNFMSRVEMAARAREENEENEEAVVRQGPAPGQGVAFEVHNHFSLIDIPALANAMNIDMSVPYTKPVLPEIKSTVSNILETMGDNELMRRYDVLLPKINVVKFDSTLKTLIHGIIQFVLQQNTEFQQNYVKYWINDCFEAYGSGEDTTSCVDGIRERLVTSVASAGFDQPSPIYERISSIIYPLSNTSINHFISKCIQDNKEVLRGAVEMPRKIDMLTACVVKKISDSNPLMHEELIKTRIEPLIDSAKEMLEDEYLEETKMEKEKPLKQKQKGMQKNTDTHKKEQKTKNKDKDKEKDAPRNK